MGGDQQRGGEDGASLPALAEVALQLQGAYLHRECHQGRGMVGQRGELSDEHPAAWPLHPWTQGGVPL